MFGGIPDFRARLVRSADDGRTCWTEWHWWGNRTDGQPLDMRGVAVFELQDGLIVGGRLYIEPVEHGSNIEQAVEMQSGVRQPNKLALAPNGNREVRHPSRPARSRSVSRVWQSLST
jgi:hypothetical protein